jgi:hypothetical protein
MNVVVKWQIINIPAVIWKTVQQGAVNDDSDDAYG